MPIPNDHPRPNPLQVLIKSIHEDNLCRSPNGRVWVARKSGPATADVIPLRSLHLRDNIFNDVFVNQDSFPTPADWRHALHCWQAIAQRLNANPDLRVSGDGRTEIILDMHGGRAPGNAAIRIRPQSWTHEAFGPGAFYRPATSRPLPQIDHDDLPAFHSLDPLRALFHCATPADWHRIVIWLLSVLRPDSPYPILILQGPCGSGKTVAAKMLRSLLDPAVTPILPIPPNERRLHAQALDNFILAYDHVTTMPPRLSDMLCRLATGATIYIHGCVQELRRPILLTVPDHANWTPSPDLSSRILVVNLTRIPDPRPSVEIAEKFTAAHNPALRALCDAISRALAHQKDVGRPSDRETWARSALTDQEITDALQPVRREDRLLDTLVDLVAQQPNQRWRGTPTALLQALPDPVRPQTARQLITRLSIIASDLESKAVEIVRTKVKGNTRIVLQQKKLAKTTPTTGTPQANPIKT